MAVWGLLLLLSLSPNRSALAPAAGWLLGATCFTPGLTEGVCVFFAFGVLIELVGVYSTIELDAAHCQLSSTQSDPIPEAFNVKRSIRSIPQKLNSVE